MIAEGQVISLTRGYLWILSSEGLTLKGKRANSSLDAAIGDFVRYRINESSDGEQSHGEILVEETCLRRSLIQRSHANRHKNLAANIDHAFIVTAPPPLFNTNVLDRMLCELRNQAVPCSIVINKIDLEEEMQSITEVLRYYESIGNHILRVSAASGAGFDLILEKIMDPSIRTIAFLGMSGVGKSSSLNRLIPEALARTNEVSTKTGQGRQTTSQGMGYHYPRENADALVLIDLPGVTQFGLCHLNPAQIQSGFTDIAETAEQCQFRNCSHTVEPGCAVREACASGDILSSRFDNFQAVLAELATFGSENK